MGDAENKIFEFGPFRLDREERVLRRNGRPVPLTLKAFDLLLLLVENSGHVVEKDQLMNRVWADAFVEEGNVKATVSMLRKALEDNHEDNLYIETVPRRGYRFVAEVKEMAAENVDLVVQELTREILTIDETRLTSTRPKSNRVLFLIGGALFVVMGIIAGFLLLKNRTQPIAPAANAASIKSIAVLPFKPLESAKRDELLELGMADTLITRLGALRKVVVRPTSAVRKYTALEQDPLAAGRELKADAILDGSIQRSADRIRINVRLIRVADGSTLWADRFDDRYSDLFVVQDSISNKIVATLALTLGGQENRQLQKRYTNNPAAYEAYVRGRYHWNRQTIEDYQKGVAQFQDAIKLDPNYALAYAGLADSYNMMGYWGVVPPQEAFPKAKEAAKKSVEIDKTLGEGHAALAYIQFEYDWDFESAERNYLRAIELNPGYANVHQWYAEYLIISGRHEDAAVELGRAREIDPLSPHVNIIAASLPYFQRNYDESIAQCQKILELDPTSEVAHDLLATNYMKKGMYEEAISNAERSFMLVGASPEAMANLRKAYETLGIKGYWRAHAEFQKTRSQQTYVSPLFVAMDYAMSGDTDKVFEWLEKAYADRSGWLLELGGDPTWDVVRDDPRFKSLMKRIRNGPKPIS